MLLKLGCMSQCLHVKIINENTRPESTMDISTDRVLGGGIPHPTLQKLKLMQDVCAKMIMHPLNLFIGL